jgi:uncharacterized membrane protein
MDSQMSIPVSNPAPTRSQMSRSFKIVLLASLALNAVFIGGLISAVLRHDRNPFIARAGSSQQNLAAYVTTLPAERRMSIFKSVSDKRQALMQHRGVVRRARDDAQASLASEPFDREKYLLAQTRLVQAEHDQRLSQRDMFVDIASAMSADERRSYIRWRGPPRGIPTEPSDAHIEKR